METATQIVDNHIGVKKEGGNGITAKLLASYAA
jgi:hypothetical protein